MTPEISTEELWEILEAAISGQEIPDIDSATQVDTWRAERAITEPADAMLANVEPEAS